MLRAAGDSALQRIIRLIHDAQNQRAPIQRFTGHVNGAVYGAPRKRMSGTTHLKNLFICGTDQGFVGIIGAMFSGIAMANRHLLTLDADSPAATELAAQESL